MTPLRKQFTQNLELRGLSPRTVKTYVTNVTRLCRHYGKSPELLTADEVREYLLHLKSNGIAPNTCNNYLASIKSFLKLCVPERHKELDGIPRQKEPKHIPVVLSLEEIVHLLTSSVNLKHRALLTIIYSAGLRLGEAVNLKPCDIDSSRMRVHVRQGKGRKDRYTILAREALYLLREYYRFYRPQTWLFEGRRRGEPICRRTVDAALRRCVKRARLGKHVTLHTLRHSFATHLLEKGCPLQVIQSVLGHKDIKTTTVYTHVTDRMLDGLTSPLEAFDLSCGRTRNPEAAHA